MVVDSHTHVVARDATRYPLRPQGLAERLGGLRHRATWFREVPVSAEELLGLMDDACVDAALLVQPMGAYGHDNAYATDSARAHPARLASVVIVDPTRDDAPLELERQVCEHGARGVRLFTVTHPESTWLDEPPGLRVCEAAARLAIPVVVTILWPQVEKLARVLRRFPELPVALDHCGFPDLSGGPPYERAAGLDTLAALPALRLKVTSIVLAQAEKEPGGACALVDHLAEAFGAERLLWGSDYSQTHDRPYADLVALARRAARNLGDRERHSFLAGSALDLWPDLAGARAAAGATRGTTA